MNAETTLKEEAMSTVSSTQTTGATVEGNGPPTAVATRDVLRPTATSSAFARMIRPIAGRLTQTFEFSTPEPHWTAWREVEVLDRTPRP